MNKTLLAETVREEARPRLVRLSRTIAPADDDTTERIHRLLDEALEGAAADLLDPALARLVPDTRAEDDLEVFVLERILEVTGANELAPEQLHRMRYRCEHEYCLRQV